MGGEAEASLSKQAAWAPALDANPPGTADVTSAIERKASGRQNLFIWRLPYQQTIEVCRLGSPCTRLYLAIRFQFGLQKGKGAVQITKARREEMGLDNRAYLRALNKLERYNIVTVKRDGKYPAKITINELGQIEN